MSETPASVWTALIAGGAALVSAVAASVTTLLVSRKPVALTAQAAETTADAAWVQAMAAGFEKLTKQYDERNKELVTMVFRLEGAVNGMSQHLLDLEDTLRKLDLPIPERPANAQWPPPDFHVLQGGKK